MSGNNGTGPGGGTRVVGGGQTAVIIVAVAALAVGAYYKIKQDSGQTETLGGASPDYIHRGAATLFNIAANSPPAASGGASTPYVIGTPYPLTDTCNTTDLIASKVYAVVKSHFGLSVDCSASAYKAAMGGTESYYAFQTVAGTLHGHAIYFPAWAEDSKESVLFSKPK